MPPKKKRSLSEEPRPPGPGRMLLQDKFSTLPTADDLRNGHVLYLYVISNKSRAETERKLKEHFVGHSFTHTLNADIKRIVSKTLDKFKKLTEPKEFETFHSICHEHFQLLTDPMDYPSTSSGHAMSSVARNDPDDNSVPCTVDNLLITRQSSHAQDTPENLPSEPSSSFTTRSSTELLTPRKARMRKQLKFLTSSSAEMRKKLKGDIKELKQKMKTPKRVINQAIGRKIEIIKKKDATIRDLKRKLHSDEMYIKFAKTKAELHKTQNTHYNLLKYREKKKRVPTVPLYKYKKLLSKLKEKEETIKNLEHENLLLQETVDELQANPTISNKQDLKTYSSSAGRKVFVCIVNKVPTASIPVIMEELGTQPGQKPEPAPKRSAVELMARELGAIAELQASEMVLREENVTLGFDATTQEGTHVNSIHFTTKKECFSAAIDVLAGGTADDYASHICQTVDSMAETYVYFNDGSDYQETRQSLIDNITNSMSDRCAANHAALRIVGSVWNKSLNELNCHLHPLDSIATSCRTALKDVEQAEGIKGVLFGKDCMSANCILQFNKLRYKDGKGDPRAFLSFLDEKNLPRGILPRYRGNRLHILFHIAGVLTEHHDTFSEHLEKGMYLTKTPGLWQT
ncbi:uncharacterized protein LOC106161101 [Lingula anatina]|uniref:Uncharacterized protein LOC106161101 n=1 Tax=Lingula anatina TaxID=7574 RepID=A0A1S3I7R1_LINAN|nr:uncharacterized protein LOC106161101 [Lingula anatina]|eukprot:XP_013393414.1 uncharacterized protein LOC106161101 [Lingula anatina]